MRGQQHNFNEAYSEAVHRSLSLPSTPSNPRNSEGDFILSKPDGRIVFIYSHFSGGQDDFAGAFLAGVIRMTAAKHGTKKTVHLPTKAN